MFAFLLGLVDSVEIIRTFMHSMVAVWKDFLLFPVISYTKRLRKELQTYVNIQNVGIFFLGD